MRVPLIPCVIGVIAAVSGWMIRGIHLHADAPPPASQIVTASAAPPSAPASSMENVTLPAPAMVSTRAGRDLFAYVAPPPVQVAQVPSPPAIIVEPPPAPAPIPTVVHEVKPFPYRYIGRFGPDDNPLAVLTRDGELVTARRGYRIGERYVLRSIGAESVEVESPDGIERIALR